MSAPGERVAPLELRGSDGREQAGRLPLLLAVGEERARPAAAASSR